MRARATSSLPGLTYSKYGRSGDWYVSPVHVASGERLARPVCVGSHHHCVRRSLRGFYREADAVLAAVDWERPAEDLRDDPAVHAVVAEYRRRFAS